MWCIRRDAPLVSECARSGHSRAEVRLPNMMRDAEGCSCALLSRPLLRLLPGQFVGWGRGLGLLVGLAHSKAS